MSPMQLLGTPRVSSLVDSKPYSTGLKAYFAPPLIQAEYRHFPGRLACPGSRLHRGTLGLPRSCKAEVDGLSTLGRLPLHGMSVCVDADVWHQKPEVEAWPPSGSL